MSGNLPDQPNDAQSVGSFLRRILWRKEIGPVSAEARVEMRELMPDLEPPAQPIDSPRQDL